MGKKKKFCEFWQNRCIMNNGTTTMGNSSIWRLGHDSQASRWIFQILIPTSERKETSYCKIYSWWETNPPRQLKRTSRPPDVARGYIKIIKTCLVYLITFCAPTRSHINIKKVRCFFNYLSLAPNEATKNNQGVQKVMKGKRQPSTVVKGPIWPSDECLSQTIDSQGCSLLPPPLPIYVEPTERMVQQKKINIPNLC